MVVDHNPAAKEPRRTVLVVDDNRQLIEFLTDALEELGNFVVVTATDGGSCAVGHLEFLELTP